MSRSNLWTIYPFKKTLMQPKYNTSCYSFFEANKSITFKDQSLFCSKFWPNFILPLFKAFDLINIVESIEKSHEESTTSPTIGYTEPPNLESEPVPSQEISGCILGFISCLETKSDSKVSSKARNCYQMFQDCSGSVILIPDLYRNTKDNP